LLAAYQKAPAVTRERLYLETLESVLSQHEQGVWWTRRGSNNLLYLPLDRLLKAAEAAPECGAAFGDRLLAVETLPATLVASGRGRVGGHALARSQPRPGGALMALSQLPVSRNVLLGAV
jgi:membrane protease subunit HflK